MPGRFSTITVDEVLASAKMQLRLTNTTEFDDFLEILINEALRSLNCLSLLEKRQCDLDIIDLKSELPVGFQRLLGLRFLKTNSVSGDDICFNLLYVDKKFLNDCKCNTSGRNLVNFTETFQIQQGFIFYNSDIGATEVTLAFLGFNVDEFGRIEIFERYERALRAYACYKFTLSYPEDFKESTTQRYQNEWRAQKQWIRGDDMQNDFMKNRWEITKLFNTMLLSDLTVT